jgi:multimeric flavodoxin WrbA
MGAAIRLRQEDAAVRQIVVAETTHPCKACVATSMAFCHWTCSCYPNYSLGQTDDWMNEIYPLWVAAHGIMITTPVHWYQAPTALKAMIDPLVCADGGNPDPSSTHGKVAKEAKALGLKGWPYPRHLAVAVHGDSIGAECLRRVLTDWLTDMALVSAGGHCGNGRLHRLYGALRNIPCRAG